jgi:CxxC motif-containing protein (DUF1111 family)
VIRAGLIFLFCLLSAAATAADHPFETPDHTRNAFGNPFPKLNRDERREFFVGNSFFKQSWVQTGSTTTARDGLGPTFNAVSCSSCHLLDGRGPGAAREGFAHVSLLFRLEGAEAQYGGQLNPFAIQDVCGEAQPFVKFSFTKGVFPDGEEFELRQPLYEIINWMFGDPPAGTRLSPRVANQAIGLGLLEKIPAAEIEALADAEDGNGDGISGKAVHVLNLRTGTMDLGRFGWKSEQPTVEQQSAAAFNGDMGLTSSLFPQENCPAPQMACQAAPAGGTPEVEDLVLERVSFYMKSLAVPKKRELPDDRGEKIFARIGCTGCHHPSYTVENIAIFPYTDLLLHDMGPALADRSLGGDILATEWRTPPLWGIGLFQTVNGHTNLMHDGRARGVQEAVLWHDGEARAAKEAYMKLSRSEREALVSFVNSL